MSNKGHFKVGFDPRRHIFSQEECKAGYTALVSKLAQDLCVGEYWAKRWAFRRMCKTEAVRYGNPDIEVRDSAQTETAFDRRKRYNTDGSYCVTSSASRRQASAEGA